MRQLATVLAALAVIPTGAAAAIAPAAPVLVSVEQSARHPGATWTLPPNVESEVVEVATTPDVASDGSFWRENVVLVDRVNGSDTRWLYAEQVPPGTYYVHVQGLDNSCLSTEGRACGLAWSNVMELRLPDDSPTLVFHQAIGDVRLGTARSAVEKKYGSGSVRTFRNYFPIGTKYARRVLTRVTYRLHGGELVVDYVGGQARVVHTTSSYYRTRSGVGVGTRIPLGRCHWRNFTVTTEQGKQTYRQCDHRWGDFVWEGDCGDAWLAGNRRVLTALFTSRGKVSGITLGDPDVILYCF